MIERCSHSYNDGKSSTFGAPNFWNGGAASQSFTALRQGLRFRTATPTESRRR